MAATARLSPELQSRAKIYALRLGISINALIAVALDMYLDLKEAQGREADAAEAAQEARSGPVARPQGQGRVTPQPQPATQPELSRRERKRLARVDRAKGKGKGKR